MGYSSDATGLSPEVRRALQLAAEGLGDGAIAARLGCDVRAVQHHLADAIWVLDARSVSDAVEVAIRHGLLEPPSI